MKRALILLALAPLGGPAQEFNVSVVWKELGGNNPEFSAAKLDPYGRVVGNYRTSADSRTTRAALWTDGTIKTFEGLGSVSGGQAINRSGVIAGYARVPGTESTIAGYWGADGAFRDLGVPRSSVSKAITTQGTILGELTQRQLPRGFVWKNGVRTDIPVFDERNESHPEDMNDSEVVVGYEHGGGGGYWTWDAAKGLRRIPVRGPVDINEAGMIGGWALVDGKGYAATYFNGELRLFEENLWINALNDTGWFVGSGPRSLGILWRNGGPAERLSDLIDPGLGFEIRSAFGINDAGQILAWAQKPGEYYGYTVRLDPVPEPASLAALALGLAALAGRRRGKP